MQVPESAIRRRRLRIILPLLTFIVLGMQACGIVDRNVMKSRCGSLTPFPMDPEIRVHLKDQPEIRAFHYKPLPFLPTHIPAPPSPTGGSSQDSYGEIYGKDPILSIKDRLISVVAEDVGIKVRSIDVPLPMLEDSTQSSVHDRCHHDTLGELSRRLQKGLIMDFTSDWSLEADVGFHLTRWYLTYSARARLIRLEEPHVLWQGICAYVSNDPPSNRPTLNVLEEHGQALLNVKINDAAHTCIQELTRQFQGN